MSAHLATRIKHSRGLEKLSLLRTSVLEVSSRSTPRVSLTHQRHRFLGVARRQNPCDVLHCMGRDRVLPGSVRSYARGLVGGIARRDPLDGDRPPRFVPLLHVL